MRLMLATLLAAGVAGAQVEERLPDFEKPFFGCDEAIGERKMLTILWDPHREEHPAPKAEEVEALFFGEERSVQGYFLENSGGRFTLTDAGMLGWYDADKPAEHYWGPKDEGDQDGDGWVSGHTEKWAEAIRKADAEFDFAAHDADGDKVLTPAELGIHIVIPQNNPFGTNRPPAGRQHPEREPLVVDGVRIPVIAESYIGRPPNLELVVHELAHMYLNAPDEYFTFRYPYCAGPFSLMDWHGACGHLDPFLKLRLGWATPRFVTTPGPQTIGAVETGGDVLVLCDPERSTSEYFLIENRWPEDTYESKLPDRGLAVWHIVDDPEALGDISAPPGCEPEQWGKITAGDWGRRAIRLLRPTGPEAPDNKRALWDGSEPETAYDLLSEDPDATHATLTWADGTPSGFSLLEIPEAGPEVTVLIGAGGEEPQAREPSRVLNFCVIADAHTYTGNLVYLPGIVDRINALEVQPDFVVSLGDNVSGHEDHQVLDDAVAYHEVVSRLRAPHHYVIGNHECIPVEVYKLLTWEQLLGAWEMDSRWYSFDAGSLHVCVLDGWISLSQQGFADDFERQKAWLLQDLESTDRPTVVFVHQAIGFQQEDCQEWVDSDNRKFWPEGSFFEVALESHADKVVAVFEGHKHKSLSKVRRGVTYHQMGASHAHGGQFAQVFIDPETRAQFVLGHPRAAEPNYQQDIQQTYGDESLVEKLLQQVAEPVD